MITIVAEAEERRDPRARGSDLVATLARHGVQVEQGEMKKKTGRVQRRASPPPLHLNSAQI